jgi:hypothetical protein
MTDDNTTEPAPQAARVQKAGDWHLVTYGAWQISVAPDGLLMLPRHLHPDHVADFAACAQVAVDVGRDVIAANEARVSRAPSSRRLSSRRAVVTQGPPPEGTTRMRQTSAAARAASIGRGKRRQRGGDSG